MADSDKLWFELGVRDHVTANLRNIILEADKVRDAMHDMMDVVNPIYSNAKQLEGVFDRIDRTIRDINKVKLSAVNQDDVNRLNEIQAKLKEMRRTFEGVGKTDALMGTEGYVALEKMKQGYELAIQQATKYANTVRQASDYQRKFSEGIIDTYNKISEAGKRTNTVMDQLKNQFTGYVSLYGMERLVKSIIQIGGEFEVQHIALQSILGDVQQANSMFEQMKELAVLSPFNFRQLAAYSKQIAAFNIPYEEMYDTTKRLADMSAGLGVDMSRLVLAYGQVRSAAVLRGQELRQFTEAGIPMVQALADEFTKLNGRAVSTAEVFELISKRAVPFEMVKKVLWDMTSEGGRFFDMQFTLSDTLAGKWSNLQDAWEIMLSEFAKGESLSGKLLKSMVTLLTKITETANALLPIIAGGGMFYFAKKFSSITSGMGLSGIDNYIQKAQKAQAIELRRKLINQEITKEQYNQGMTMNNSRAKYYVLLANEGKLKDYQIQRLLIQNKINNARLQELVKSGELTMREAAQVRLWRMKNAEVSAFQMRLNGIKSSVGGFFKANAWLIAIDVVITALTSWYAKVEEAKEKNQELTKSFENSAKQLKESYNALNDNNLNSDEDYKGSIQGLKEQLKLHSENYEAIVRQANSIEDLKEQYIFLKNALYEEAMVAFEAESKAEKFGEATRKAFEEVNEYARYKTTGRQSMWDVLLGADTDVDRGLEKKVKKLYDRILEVVPNAGKNEMSNELYRKLRNGIEEQLGFGSKEKMLINIKLNELIGIDNVEDATTLVIDKFTEMLSKASPRIANKIKNNRDLNEAEKEKVNELINEATEETKKKYPYYADTLQRLLNDSNFIANIQLRFSQSGKMSNDFQKWVYNNMDPLLSEDIKNIATSWAESGNSYDAQNAAKNDIDAARNEYESRKKQTKLAQKNLNEARKRKAAVDEIKLLESQIKTAEERENKGKTDYENKKTAALQGIGYDYEGELKKSNKEKSSREKDDDLKSAKTRLDFIKKFYSEYKKYREVYGASKAQSIVENIFGMEKGAGSDIIKNYKEEIKKVFDIIGNSFGTEERKKFKTAVEQLLGDIELDDVKEKARIIGESIREELSRQSEEWSLYEEVLKNTGNKDIASMAFGDDKLYGKLWNDQARSLAAKLQTMMKENLEEGGKILVDWDAEEKTAEQYFKSNFKNGEALFDVWKSIVKLLRGNYMDSIRDISNATAQLLTDEEKIKKIEDEIAELRRNGVKDNDPRMIKKQKELEDAQADAFTRSTDYLRFYEAILSMTVPEAEAIGQKIRQNLNRELKNGTITASKLLKEIKNIDSQMKKLKENKNSFSAFISGGLSELFSNQYEKSSADYANGAIKFEKAKQAYDAAVKKGDQAGMKQAEASKESAMSMMQSAGSQMEAMQSASSTLAIIDLIVHGIDNAVQGIKATFDEIRSTYDALGHDTETNDWQDWNTFWSSFSSASSSATKAWDSLKSGDAGGLINGIVGSFTGWIKGFALGHDAKRDKQIQIAQQQLNAIERLRTTIEKGLNRTLGGVYNYKASQESIDKLRESMDRTEKVDKETYDRRNWGIHQEGDDYKILKGAGVGASIGLIAGPIGAAIGGVVGGVLGGIFGSKEKYTVKYYEDDTLEKMDEAIKSQSYYDEQWALLYKQRDELVHQLAAEEDKKKSDDEKIEDYKAQIAEVKDQIEHFAEDMAKALWDIDVKDWASQLGDALFEAWQKGESGAEAFKKKASEIIASLAQKIAVTKLIEEAMKPVLKIITDEMERTDGLFDNISIQNIASAMSVLGETLPDSFNALMDGLNEGMIKAGLTDMKSLDNDGSTSSSNTIKSITENTADLIASYINAIRADVSVNRLTLSQILIAVQSQNDMPVVARAQLAQLQQITTNTGKNAEAAVMIYDLLHRISPDGTSFKVK